MSDDRVERAHVQLVEIAADAVFAAAATAVVGVLASAVAVILVGGWLAVLVVAVTVPAPLVAASYSLNGRVTRLRERLARGQQLF